MPRWPWRYKLTPGTNEKRYLAGALDVTTGTIAHCVWYRKTTGLFLPTYCPRANPIERVFGDVHDKYTRNHTRKRLWHLVQDVTQHLHGNGPWRYALSDLYYTPEVTAAVQTLRAGQTALEEISPLAA